MAKLINLTGKRFGSYTVLKRAENKNGLTRYECRCDCGKIKILYATNLVSGRATSCGCSRRSQLLGKRFGRLTVIGNMEIRNGKSYWECQCDCGNSVVVRADMLKCGTTISCGCWKKENDVKKGKKLHQKYENTRVDGVVVATLVRKSVKNTTSNYKGVSYYARSGKWQASIYLMNQNFYLGRYDTEEEAYRARIAAEQILHEPFIKKYQEVAVKQLDEATEKQIKEALKLVNSRERRFL